MKPRILLTESDSPMRENWAEALELAKFEVEQAHTPRESLYRFCIQTPDIMVLSLDVPVMDGLKTITLMKNFAPSCPLVILAAETEAYTAVVRPGIDVVLRKPVETSGLLQAIKSLAQPILLQRMEVAGDFIETELPPARRRSSGGRHYQKRVRPDGLKLPTTTQPSLATTFYEKTYPARG